jgi:hypothetical protein
MPVDVRSMAAFDRAPPPERNGSRMLRAVLHDTACRIGEAEFTALVGDLVRSLDRFGAPAGRRTSSSPPWAG